MTYIECSYLQSYLSLEMCSTMCRINRQYPMMGPWIKKCRLSRLWGCLSGRRLSGRLRDLHHSGRLRRGIRIWRGGQMVHLRRRHLRRRQPSEVYSYFWISMDIWTCMNSEWICMDFVWIFMDLYDYCEDCHIGNIYNVFCYMPVKYIWNIL